MILSLTCIALHLATTPVFAAAVALPQQLQVNYQRAPALGVGPLLRFSWAVPAADTGSTAQLLPRVQRSYAIVITDAASNQTVWESGLVDSAESINIEVDGREKLRPGAAYRWTVACDGGAPSDPAVFVTALWNGFDPAARWIWAADVNASQHYANLRSTAVISASTGKRIATALLFVTAWQEPTMLASYKFYIDGKLVSLGPGRGEADVMSGDPTFLRAPYSTVDVTGVITTESILAVEGMAPLFQAPCDLHACQDTNVNGGGVLAQLELTFDDGTAATVTTGGSHWDALAQDAYRNPTAPAVKVGFLSGETAYSKVLENIDASKEAIGWKTSNSLSPPWPAAKPSQFSEGGDNHTGTGELVAKMARPLVVQRVPPAQVQQNQSHPTSFFVDFGKEFQGGVILNVDDAKAGTVLRFIASELLLPNGTSDATTQSRYARLCVSCPRWALDSCSALSMMWFWSPAFTLNRLDPLHTWGYSFNWTLREGRQTIEQHNYMIFRSASP